MKLKQRLVQGGVSLGSLHYYIYTNIYAYEVQWEEIHPRAAREGGLVASDKQT